MVGYPGTVERGAIRDPKKIARLRDFTGLQFGKITPTDVDGLLEFGGRCYVLIEAKRGNAPLPDGQRIAYERLSDDLMVAGKPMLVLHLVEVGTEPIDYAKCLVARARIGGEWTLRYSGLTCREAIDRFRKEIGI